MNKGDYPIYMPPRKPSTNKIRLAREQARISRAEMSRRTGILTHTLETWENGSSNPAASQLKKVVIVLNEIYFARGQAIITIDELV